MHTCRYAIAMPLIISVADVGPARSAFWIAACFENCGCCLRRSQHAEYCVLANLFFNLSVSIHQTLHEFWWGSLVFRIFLTSWAPWVGNDCLFAAGWLVVRKALNGGRVRMQRVFSTLQRIFSFRKKHVYCLAKKHERQKTPGSNLKSVAFRCWVALEGTWEELKMIVRCSIHTCADQLGLLKTITKWKITGNLGGVLLWYCCQGCSMFWQGRWAWKRITRRKLREKQKKIKKEQEKK